MKVEPHFWSDFNWSFLIGVMVASGLFAYLGDILGTKIGKKRISVFGLRPKYTGSIITAFTGVIIALVVLLSLSVTSDTVRTALFSMKFLQSQITQLTSDLQSSRDEAELTYLRLVETQDKLQEQETRLSSVGKELAASTAQLEENEKELSNLRQERQELEKTIADLRIEAEQAKQGLTQVRGGRIVAFADELLSQHAVDAGASPELVESILDRLVQRADYIVAARLGADPGSVHIDVDPQLRNQVIEEIARSKGRQFIRLMADSNILVGESVKVKLEVRPSQLIYTKDLLLWTEHIPTPPGELEAESFLHSLLRNVNSKAVSDGVLPDPVSGTVGILDASDFFDAVEELSSSGDNVTIRIYTKDEVFTEGPVRIRIEIEQEVKNS
jgi:uncharacterized protein (DUF3084 family)